MNKQLSQSISFDFKKVQSQIFSFDFDYYQSERMQILDAILYARVCVRARVLHLAFSISKQRMAPGAFKNRNVRVTVSECKMLHWIRYRWDFGMRARSSLLAIACLLYAQRAPRTLCYVCCKAYGHHGHCIRQAFNDKLESIRES